MPSLCQPSVADVLEKQRNPDRDKQKNVEGEKKMKYLNRFATYDYKQKCSCQVYELCDLFMGMTTPRFVCIY